MKHWLFMTLNKTFGWDESKNQANLKKHRVDFNYAIFVFLEEHRIETEDNRKDYGEVRYKVVGRIECGIFTVIYTPRDGCFRIISARGARRDEKEDYLRNLKTWE